MMEKNLKGFHFEDNQEAVLDFKDLLSAMERCIRHVDRAFEKEIAFGLQGMDFLADII
ncbi:MAG: hypothetical protein IJ333_05885 [Clostridia bacterium]|nr:hypothetical protein [Clostridia bacterium]